MAERICLTDYTNIKSFYNYLMEKIYDDDYDLYKNLGEEQKKLCLDRKIRIIIIIQNNKSKKYFKDIFRKCFPDVMMKTDDIMIIIKEFTKINIAENFIDELDKIKNNFVKKFIKNQTTITDYITDFNSIIIGCPDSTDIDVIVIVDDKYDIDNININEIDVISQLEYKCKYILDKTKKIDINIINIKNKKVTKSQKGSIKTIQGIIYSTSTYEKRIYDRY